MTIEEGRPPLPVAGDARAAVARPPTSRWKWRGRIVRFGIRAIWGASSTIPASAAGDVPLLRAGIRLAWLRLLDAGGVRTITSISGLGHPFVCHIGDLAEHPFYDRRACRHELQLAAAWLDGIVAPVVYDVGANVGFVATQLAQMLPSATVHAFE